MDAENLQTPVTFLTNVFDFFTEIVERNQRKLFDKMSITIQIYDGILFFTRGVCVKNVVFNDVAYENAVLKCPQLM